MFKNINLLKTSVVLCGVMCVEGNADCPTLDLKTLPKAVCSSKDKPYSDTSFKYMKYYAAQSECGKDKLLGMRKFLQSAFEGKKSYPGKESDVTEGNLQCIYTLTKGWQKALNTKESKVILETPLSSLKHLTVGKSLCPDLVADHLENFKQNKPIEIEGTHRGGFSFEYELKIATKLGSASKAEKFKWFLGAAPATDDLTPLQPSKVVSDVNFTHVCTYNYKKGKTSKELVLKGISDLK
ncbi:MAG: hypothetical protein HYS39_00905 [Proteobacteria bacterium]|nr:hypothetical protein [Pseudomonadota bacterium]